MRPEFESKPLNEQGLAQSKEIAEACSACLDRIAAVLSPGRPFSLVVTKMQEAKMFAVAGIAENPANHAPESTP